MQDWTVATASRRGAHHERGGRPNEDHVRADGTATPLVVAVADGHGAPQYTRADRGARLATRAAVEVLRSHHEDVDALPHALVARWRELVAEDVRSDPPDEARTARHAPHELYGTTLLAAADLGDRLLLVQLGDGDTVLARRDGDDLEVRRPIPAIEYSFPGATDSLVQDDAASVTRIAEVPRDDLVPQLVLLATDGIDASRDGRSWHRAVADELLRALQGRPVEEAQAFLDEWCAAAARTGGDDSTVAVLVAHKALDATT